jgi:succinate dehydrogenase / fumarate reductase cytochrome b subunit
MSSAESGWRRWHRISGALALGLFLVAHLVTNASVVAGETAYRRVVVASGRSSVVVAIQVLVLLVLAFHAGYGVSLAFLRKRASDADAAAARYGDRRWWAVQRALAVVVLVFLAVHLSEVALPRLTSGLTPNQYYTVLAAHLSWTWAGVPWFAIFYLVGLGATAFHFANGLSAASGGGPVPGVRKTTVALGLVLFALGSASVVSFATGTRLLPAPTPTEEESPACGPSAGPFIPRIKAQDSSK